MPFFDRSKCPFCHPEGRPIQEDRFCRIIDDKFLLLSIPRGHGEPTTLLKKHCIVELRKVAEKVKDERGGDYRIETSKPASGHWHAYVRFRRRSK